MKKQNIITFKVDKTLMEVIRDIPNRSQFIRAAIVSALGSVCPVCDGAGMLTPNQKRHWDDFSVGHRLETCKDCDEQVLVCCGKE
ncbi:MAG: CopG family transcriptional regulator [Deltaproteobacteria bacterium]|nr:CopG family transcriptional regulator [Deltaproteobacteria bacterium]MBW2283513.1 CopG family transcriptional regulator [Deltaproteobacteria bacterium]